MKKIYLISLAVLLILPVTSYAAPQITKVTGIMADNQSITITGSGFGTAPQDVDLLNFDAGTAGDPLSESGWVRSTPSKAGIPWTTPVYADNRSHSSKNSIKCSYPDSGYACSFSKTFAEPIGKAYVSFWLYADYKQFSSKNRFQWKMVNVSPMAELGHFPAFTIDQWPNADGSCYQAYHGNRVTGTSTTYTFELPGNNIMWRDCFPRSEWIRIEFFIEESSDIGVADGTEIVNYYSSGTNKWSIWSNAKGTGVSDYHKNVVTRRIDDRWKNINFGYYIGNTSVGKDADTYWDDIYVQRGTYARVELCDSSSWSTCNLREIQKPTQWSTTGIVITANVGSFTNGSKAYLYFIDDDGNASNGWPVTIGSSTSKASRLRLNLK